MTYCKVNNYKINVLFISVVFIDNCFVYEIFIRLENTIIMFKLDGFDLNDHHQKNRLNYFYKRISFFSSGFEVSSTTVT